MLILLPVGRYAKSGRSTCRKCEAPISQGEVRMAVMGERESGGMIVPWWCVPATLLPLDALASFLLLPRYCCFLDVVAPWILLLAFLLFLPGCC